MKAIVIKRKLSDSEIFEIQKLIEESNQYELFVSDDSIPEFSKYNPKFFELDTDKKREINYDILSRILAFGDKTIEGKSISDWLAFNNSSIWYYHKFRTYFFVRNLYYKIAEVEYFSKNYEEVKYFTSNKSLANYSAIPENVNIYYQSPENKTKTNYLSFIKYLIFIFFRVIIGFSKILLLRNKKHIIIDRSQRQACLNQFTLKIENDNYNLAYLFDKIDGDFIILDEVEMPKFNTKRTFQININYFINNKKNRKRIFSESILFKAFLNPSIRKKQNRISKDLDISYNKIHSGIHDPIEKVIINHFISLHKSSLYFIFKYLAYKNFFRKNKFISIISIDENSPAVKSIFDAAKFYGIKTIGIQHGNIHKLHPAYIYTKLDKQKNIVPDYTFVWGKYWKDFLIKKGNYLPESLIVTGQIRTDIIPILQKNNKKFIKNNFDTNKKIIVFASQFQRDLEIREKAALDIFNAVKNMLNVFLIVKLHPSEINEIDYYHSLAKRVYCKNYEIIYFFDLYLLLSISDIVVTCFSTVGSETIYFNKPLITIDYLKQDLQKYNKNGVAFQATCLEELINYINKILKGELQINKQAYKNYTTNYVYKISGNVGSEIINKIKSY